MHSKYVTSVENSKGNNNVEHCRDLKSTFYVKNVKNSEKMGVSNCFLTLNTFLDHPVSQNNVKTNHGL